MLCVLLAGCGGPAAGQPSGSTSPLPTFRYNIGADPGSIDPAQDADTNETFVDLQLGATLVTPDKDLNVKPGLAQKWDVSSDGRTYTFTLRPGLTWSDGSKLTAPDFEYSIKRVLDPRTASPSTALLKPIAGAAEFSSSKSRDPAELSRLSDAVGVKATGDTTLIITLGEPAGFFLSILFAGITIPVKQQVVEQYGTAAFQPDHFVGTGPFRLKAWTPKGKLELAPNPRFYGGSPKINLTLMEIGEPTATLAAYKNNEIDTNGGVQIAASDIEAAKGDPAMRDQVGETVELSESWLQFNVTKKPFDNKALRRAIGYAMDRATLVDKVLGGAAVPSTSLIPPGMPGYIADADPAHGYDPNKARQLLAEAGFPNGQGLPANIPMAYNNLSVIPQIMQFVQSNLSAVGIKVQLDPRDSNTYFANLRQDAPALFRVGWNADYPDPNDWYRVIFETGAGPNYGHWSNADFDRVVAEAARETSPAKRDQLYNQAAQILADDPPGAWWYYNRRFRLVKPSVKGLTVTAQDGGFPGKYFIKDITISS